MATRTALLDHVSRGLTAARSDPDLLAAYVSRRDADAFRRLVERYAPLVGGICRRSLGDAHAAEDAVQTTFLALARRPGVVRGDSLAGWLCAVARRTCHKLRRTDRRRADRELSAARPITAQTFDDLSVRELLAVLDEEVARLPADTRSALLVCYWQGEPQAEAARRLGRSPAAVKGLLERGRARLLARLARRGLTADVALRALLVAPAGLVAISSDLLASLTRVAQLPVPSIPKLGPAVGGVAMTSAIVGVGLWLATVPAQTPPPPPPPPPKPAVAAAPRPVGVDALGDPLPEAALLRLGTLRFRHPNSSHELGLSPDGNTVVTVGESIIAWESATGKELWRFRPDRGEHDNNGSYYGCRVMTFAPDGRVLTPGRPDEVLILDALTGKSTPLKVQKGGPPERTVSKSIHISPDGKTIALGSAAGVTVCDFDGKVKFEIANNPTAPLQNTNGDRLAFGGHFSYAMFAPKGNVLAAVVSEAPQAIRLVNATTGDELRRVALGGNLVRLDFSPDGTMFFATERDQSVRAYAVETGKRLWTRTIKLTNPYENYTSAVAVDPAGKTVAVGATDNIIHLLDAKSGEQVGKLAGHGWYSWGLAFTADGSTLFSTGWDGPVRRWNVAERKQLPLPVGIRGSEVVAASPDGKTLAYMDDGGTVRLVDAATGAERRTLQVKGASYTQLLFSPDGRRLAGGGTSGDNVYVAVWDLTRNEVLRRWEWPKGTDPHSVVECLSFTPDGSRLAAAMFRQSSARVWDIDKNRQIAHLAHSEIYGLSFSPDGGTLATAGWDKRIRLWNPETAKVRREIEVIDGTDRNPDNRMYTVCYAPHGGLIATAHLDGYVRIWDAGDLSLKTSFHEDRRFIFGSIAFSPDGLWLATGTMMGLVNVWDPRSGTKVWDRGRHDGYVYTVRFGRDSRTMLSGGNDGVGYLWDLRPKEKSTKEPTALWDELAGADGPAAYRAVWALADMPDKAIALFRDKLRIEPPADPARMKTLIAELDDPKFATRSVAQTELSKLGARAAGPLREALAKATSTEQRDRLTKLIDEIKAAARPAELRNRRAVTVLDWIGTAEARGLLDEWAKGDPDGSLGGPAGEALKR
jgi:RNA polymerase sigma factor (sigma-70 family)